jgi:hypothetical protein
MERSPEEELTTHFAKKEKLGVNLYAEAHPAGLTLSVEFEGWPKNSGPKIYLDPQELETLFNFCVRHKQIKQT